MDVFNLKAILSLDSSGFDSGLDKAGATLGKVGGALKTGFTTIAKVGTVALGAASAGVIALTKNSVQSYADYEQMVGGVQKLYGNMGQSLEEYAKSTGKSISEVKTEWGNLEKAQNIVLDNAKNAYKTAGMSANQYMDMATSFSASLINSLGGDTVKAAEQTDVAMRAISDNFNTFGGDIGMIQGAFQGFAKQNYTMLDNLKLGYGGTKSEMERLIADANEYAASIGEASDLSIDSFADIVTAIDLVQKKQNIWGTTSREASTTIAGSIGMAKAAWQNLVTGFADGNADIGTLMNNLINSVVGYTDEMGKHVNGVLDNLFPAIETALVGISQGIARIAPVIAEKLPGLITEIAPSLIDAAWQIVQTLGSALMESAPQIIGYVNDVLMQVLMAIIDFDFASAASNVATKMAEMFDPSKTDLEASLIAKAFAIVEALATGLADALPTLLPAAMDMISYLVNILADQAQYMLEAAVNLVIGLAEGLTNPTALNNMITSAMQLIMSLADGLIDALPRLYEKAPIIIDNLVNVLTENAPKLIVCGIELIIKLQLGMIQALPQLVAAIPQIIGSLVSGFIDEGANLIKSGNDLIKFVKEGFESLNPAEWGRDMIDSLVSGIKSGIGKVKDAVGNIASTIKSYIHFTEPDVGPLSNFHTYAPDMMKSFAKGIIDNAGIVEDAMNKSFGLPSITENSTGSSSVVNGGTVVINVYGAEGQSEERLADIIQNKMLQELNMQRAVKPSYGLS